MLRCRCMLGNTTSWYRKMKLSKDPSLHGVSGKIFHASFIVHAARFVKPIPCLSRTISCIQSAPMGSPGDSPRKHDSLRLLRLSPTVASSLLPPSISSWSFGCSDRASKTLIASGRPEVHTSLHIDALPEIFGMPASQRDAPASPIIITYRRRRKERTADTCRDHDPTGK
jgi:hypothetical protein